MLNEYLLDLSNAIWNDTGLAQHGGVIFNTPCRLHRPPFEVGFLVHATSAVLPGRTDVLPVVRSTQYASVGAPAAAVNVVSIYLCLISGMSTKAVSPKNVVVVSDFGR